MSMRGGDTKSREDSADEPALDPWSYNEQTPADSIPLRLLSAFSAMARSDDQATAFQGVLMIRKLLTVQEDPPIQAVVDAGVVPLLVQYLERDDWPEMQFEAAWAVSTIARGAKETAVQRSALKALSKQCQSKSLESADPWRQFKWLSSDCITNILPLAASLLHDDDHDVAADACWVLSCICDKSVEGIQHILKADVIGKIVQMLQSNNDALRVPALHTIGNIVASGDVMRTQTVIDNGALTAFHGLLRHTDNAIKKEVCWCLSNICAGSADQVQSIIAVGLYPVIIELMDAPEDEVKKEAVFCLTNTTSNGTSSQLEYLIELGVVQPLCRALTHNDAKIVCEALESLENFLQLGEEEKIAKGYDRNPVADMIISCGGTEHIQNLGGHDSHELRDMSERLIEGFFPDLSVGFDDWGNMQVPGRGGDGDSEF